MTYLVQLSYLVRNRKILISVVKTTISLGIMVLTIVDAARPYNVGSIFATSNEIIQIIELFNQTANCTVSMFANPGVDLKRLVEICKKN